MVLDLRSLFVNDGQSRPLDCRFDLSEVEFFGQYPLKSPVLVKGSIFSRAGIVTLSVQCDCEYTAPCDRCGNTAVKHYLVPIERVLVAELENDEDDEMILLQDYKLDLDELVFTEVVVNLLQLFFNILSRVYFALFKILWKLHSDVMVGIIIGNLRI